MIRTITWYIYFWLYQLFALPKYFVLKSKSHKGHNITDEVYTETVKWARSLIKLAGGKVSVEGLENIPTEGPVVFVANHQGNFDIPTLIGYLNRPIGFIAKAETEKMPIVGGWMKNMRCVFLDRENPRAALKAIKSGIEIVKSGHAIVIFPEGTRSVDGKVDEFKPGSFKLAMKAEAMIVPVTISGTYDMMPKGSKRIKPAEVKLTISEPIPSTGYESTESYILREKVRDVIISKL
ncbi:MAG: 1-acyl-sn-glycerol-3-phosphate acyltransferase [Clostridia bacterium]|nr:1-acyl-sn-glycerol-3-phosphate acyltransferase [Clostridia bacterium]